MLFQCVAMKPRQTKQKAGIIKAMELAERPLSPLEIQGLAQKEVPLLSLATVYRVIRSLVADKAIVPIAVPGEPDRYETVHRAAHHHHHFLCDSCDRVFDIPGCGLRIDTQLPGGFSIARHEVMLYGSCGDCSSRV